MRTMYDAINALNLPTGGDLYAGYIGGSWPDANAISQRFPHDTVVRIAVQASENDGVVLDVEKGDATPAESVDWVLHRRAAGVDPTVYCNTSTWPDVVAAFQARGVPLPHWWAAAYVKDPSKPPTALPAGAVALQWYDFGPYDASIVADYWPGVDPKPAAAALVQPAQLEEEDTMAQAQNGLVTFSWSEGERHIVQVACDLNSGANQPELRVVLLLEGGPVVLAGDGSGHPAWKPDYTAAGKVFRIPPEYVAKAYGLELQPVGTPARYAANVG
jgi:hypothetical protein